MKNYIMFVFLGLSYSVTGVPISIEDGIAVGSLNCVCAGEPIVRSTIIGNLPVIRDLKKKTFGEIIEECESYKNEATDLKIICSGR